MLSAFSTIFPKENTKMKTRIGLLIAAFAIVIFAGSSLFARGSSPEVRDRWNAVTDCVGVCGHYDHKTGNCLYDRSEGRRADISRGFEGPQTTSGIHCVCADGYAQLGTYSDNTPRCISTTPPKEPVDCEPKQNKRKPKKPKGSKVASCSSVCGVARGQYRDDNPLADALGLADAHEDCIDECYECDNLCSGGTVCRARIDGNGIVFSVWSGGGSATIPEGCVSP
jgi:hypothetical protein